MTGLGPLGELIAYAHTCLVPAAIPVKEVENPETASDRLPKVVLTSDRIAFVLMAALNTPSM
jgi:hypothetical protein